MTHTVTRHRLRRIMVSAISFIVLFAAAAGVSAQEFPLRAEYPGVPFIESEELHRGYESGEFLIVDVRSKIEYDVIHPDGAIHLPLSDRSFVQNVEELRADNPGKKIAFYCNGTTCAKSYEATKAAQEAGLENSFVYDAGIPAWAELYPQQTKLLGQTLRDPEEQLISDATFDQRTLAYEDFTAQLRATRGMAIDVRDAIQRAERVPSLESARTIPLDNFIPNFVARRLSQDTTLFIFDQVGKQVRWLDYYLNENGYTDYYFLEGGATAVLEVQEYHRN